MSTKTCTTEVKKLPFEAKPQLDEVEQTASSWPLLGCLKDIGYQIFGVVG